MERIKTSLWRQLTNKKLNHCMIIILMEGFLPADAQLIEMGVAGV